MAERQRTTAADLLRAFRELTGAGGSVTPRARRRLSRSGRGKACLSRPTKASRRRSPRTSCTARFDAIPRDVRDEAKRAIVNYLGCALGGSIEPALDVAIRNARAVLRQRDARACSAARERFDALHAALLNGIGSHVHEYDDTLPKNYHPSERAGRLGAVRATRARIRCRAATSCTRSFWASRSNRGSATPCIRRTTRPAGTSRRRPAYSARPRRSASCSVSTRKQMVWAFGLAATQAAGIREMFGSMAKSFQPGPRRAERLHGRAARAARISRPASARSKARAASPRSRPRSTTSTRSPRGSAKTSSCATTPTSPTRAGSSCIPTIDGCSQLHARVPSDGGLDRRRARCAWRHSCSICATREDLKRALESKYSIYHAAAIGLVRGKGGLQEFTDEAVADPALAARARRDDAGRRRDDHRGPGAHRGRPEATARS